MIPPKELLDSLRENNLVIFVGSGFSKPLGLLDWNKLAELAIDEFKQQDSNVEYLRKCLQSNVLNEIAVFDALYNINPEKIEQFIKTANNKIKDSSNLDLHRKLWKISERIITTNYDKALELSKPDHTIETICNNSNYEVSKSLRLNKWLYHLHGKVDDIQNCIIFSKDYHRLYNEQNGSIEQLRSLAANNTFLFIGFSMKDRFVSNLFNNLDIVFKRHSNNDRFILLHKDDSLKSTYLQRIDIANYDMIPGFLDILIHSKELQLQSPVTITRYLRRRCRTFYPDSAEFNSIMIELRNETFKKENIVNFK